MLNIKILTYDFVQKHQKKVALFMGHPVENKGKMKIFSQIDTACNSVLT